MAKIMILGASGSGKSSSIGEIPEFKHKGVNPEETFIIGCSNKGLPFPGWKKLYKRTLTMKQNGVIIDMKPEGNYIIANNGISIANVIQLIDAKRDDIKNIIIDDMNYPMQDYYMANASKGGYDVFKQIGLFMGKIFDAMEGVNPDTNIIVMAHLEEYKSKNNDKLSFRFKTVGNMVQQYITPEGKFEIVLFADQIFNEDDKSINKVFVTNYDGEYPAKSPVGMFDQLHIPNDLGYVLNKIKEYEN